MNLGSDLPPPSHGDGLTSPPAGEGCSRPLAIGLTIFLVLAAGAIGTGVGRCTRAPSPAPSSVMVVRPTGNVITAVRDLARLEGAEFQIERVIDLTDKQTRFFGLIEAKDALLLVASGAVVAGVDLSELADDAVTLDAQKKTARLRLPPVKILSSRIDNDRTYVHTRQTDVLAERKESLESRARQEAERAIVQAATQGGIMARAQQNCRRTIEALVRSLGYDRIEIEFGAGG